MSELGGRSRRRKQYKDVVAAGFYHQEKRKQSSMLSSDTLFNLLFLTLYKFIPGRCPFSSEKLWSFSSLQR